VRHQRHDGACHDSIIIASLASYLKIIAGCLNIISIAGAAGLDLFLFNVLLFFTILAGCALMFRGVTPTTDRLLQDAYNVEVLLVKQNTLLFQVVRDNPLLLPDGFRASVNFLKQHLHEVGLTNR